MFKPNLVMTVLLLQMTSYVFAADDLNELAYYQELPVVLTASRLSQPLSEAPNAMTVIDRRMIVASGFRSIPDLFKLVPGMYVSYYKGSQAFVSYHGATDQYARRMQVMIDGRSVYMPPVSTVDWADLPITVDDIERIEVIRGPAAASHGANSTQGVISIITREAGEMAGARLAYIHGNKGINDVSARFGRRGEKFDYRMTLAYTADNGYDDLTSPPNGMTLASPRAPTLLNNSHDSNQARLINYRANYHPNAVDNFDIQFGYNHDVQGVGFNDKNSETNGNTFHDLIADSGFFQSGWVRTLGNDSELSVRYYHIQQKQHESMPYYQAGVFYAGPITQSTQVTRDDIEVQHTLYLSPSNRLVYGAAYRLDKTSGQGNIPLSPVLAYSASSKADEYRFFAHDEWRASSRLLVNAGAMLERNGLSQQNFSPRVSVNYHLTPKHTLRMGASVAYRTPSLVEQSYPIDRFMLIAGSYPSSARNLYLPGALFVSSQSVTSPGLVAEKLVSREIGYLGELFDGSCSLDVRLFSDQVSDAIKIASNRFVNGRSALHQGLESTFKHSFGESSDFIFNFAHELASSPDGAMASQQLSDSIPRNSASLLYSHLVNGGFSYSAAYYYQDAMQPFDRGPVDHQPIQRRMDVRFAQAIPDIGGMDAEISLVVQNLFDQPYTEYVANNVFNRRAYLKLALDF